MLHGISHMMAPTLLGAGIGQPMVNPRCLYETHHTTPHRRGAGGGGLLHACFLLSAQIVPLALVAVDGA